MGDGTMCPEILTLLEKSRGMEDIVMPQDIFEMKPHHLPSLFCWKREVRRQCVKAFLHPGPLRIDVDGRNLSVRSDGAALTGAVWVACTTMTTPR